MEKLRGSVGKKMRGDSKNRPTIGGHRETCTADDDQERGEPQGTTGPETAIDHDTVTANTTTTSVHAGNAWKSDDPGIGANKTTQAAIKRAQGVGRRGKQHAH